MWTQHLRLLGFLFVVLTTCAGCKESQAKQPDRVDSVAQPMISVHWIGAKKLATDPNAAGFLKIWQLPQSQLLRMQILDKLAVAPWRLSSTNRPAITNSAALLREYPSSALLRPLLDDLVQEECYLEATDSNGKAGNLALAVRLDKTHSGIWDTNLGSVIETATRGHRAANPRGPGWLIANTSSPVSPLLRKVTVLHQNEWTIVGLGEQQEIALSQLLIRIQNTQTSASASASHAWLEASFDLQRVDRAFSLGLELPEAWPAATMTVNGDGNDVLTQGTLSFAKPLPFQIEPWNLPTNLVHEPIHSFAAVQGVKQWLSSWSWWRKANPGDTPNQLFCWGQSGSPFLDYAAAPLADAHQLMPKLGSAIMNSCNPLLASNRMGKWERAAGSDGVEWHGPAISPFVQSVKTQQGNYLLGGLSPFGLTNGAPPSGTFKELLSKPNLVYYQREITGPRVEAWLYISQIFRIVLRRAQLAPEARSIAWLRATAPLLSGSTTLVTKTAPNALSFSRTSTLGVTAFEMHLLTDWFESQDFPGRPHTLVAKLRPPPPFGRTHSGSK